MGWVALNWRQLALRGHRFRGEYFSMLAGGTLWRSLEDNQGEEKVRCSCNANGLWLDTTHLGCEK